MTERGRLFWQKWREEHDGYLPTRDTPVLAPTQPILSRVEKIADLCESIKEYEFYRTRPKLGEDARLDIERLEKELGPISPEEYESAQDQRRLDEERAMWEWPSRQYPIGTMREILPEVCNHAAS